MKYLLNIILLLLLAVGAVDLAYGQLESMPCEVENTTWNPGEQLTYKVYYNWQFIWIPAGEVQFTVIETEDSYEFNVTGKTFSSYDPFFKVRDHYYSSVDKYTGQPQYFVRKVQEGKYERYDSLSFDQANGLIHEYYGKTMATAKYFKFEMDDCTQDMVSILYHLRNFETKHIQPGNDLPINVFFDKEYFDLDIKVSDIYKGRIKGIGKHEMIHLSPQIVTGNVFKEGNEMSIYVCNDESKIPLLIESAVSVGSVKAVLVDVQNTKSNPFVD